MNKLNIGDTVQYEEVEFEVVSIDEENETYTVEDADGESHVLDAADLEIVEDEELDDSEVNEDDVNDDDDFKDSLEEMTKAAETIKGKANWNTSQMTSREISSAASKSSSQTEFFAKMMAIFGKGKDHGVGNPAGKNKNSISMNSSDASGKVAKLTEDDLNRILDGQEGLTEEFKTQASVLFEAAVNLRVSEIEGELQEAFDLAEEQLAEETEAHMAELTETVSDQVDQYLSYVAEQWVLENEVAIENNLQTELSESFMSGLHTLLEDHYIDIPSEKIDVVESLAEKVTQLEESLDEQVNSNMELAEAIESHCAEEIFDEVSEGLAMSQVDKLRTLVEGVEFSGDEDEYRAKIEIVRKKYFSEDNLTKTNLNEEVLIDEEKTELNHNIDPTVAAIAKAVSRTQLK